ncbi:eCIS core domain-containing protein [Glaciimonas sp. GG7]
MTSPSQAPLQEPPTHQPHTAQRAPDKQAAYTHSFADDYPAAVKQRKLSDMLNNSPGVLQQKALADMLNSPRVLQRQEDGEELTAQMAPAQAMEEVPLQAKWMSDAPVQLVQTPAAKPNNTGLPNALKSGIEAMSGMAMDHVKVHYNSSQPAQLNAHAYAQGSDIHIGPGQEKHLPHEAWHVVQQAQGRVRPTMQMKSGVAINDDRGLETEADVMGARAAQLYASQAMPRPAPGYVEQAIQLVKIAAVGGRPADVSRKLAMNRWKMKKRKGYTFATWKKGYEAQHIIPYSLARDHATAAAFSTVNDSYNGMMLPSGRDKAAAPVYKANARFMKRPRHIKQGWAHPEYNKYVLAKILALRKNTKGKLSGPMMRTLADELRLETKKMDPKDAIDDIGISKLNHAYGLRPRLAPVI